MSSKNTAVTLFSICILGPFILVAAVMIGFMKALFHHK